MKMHCLWTSYLSQVTFCNSLRHDIICISIILLMCLRLHLIDRIRCPCVGESMISQKV
ncbi:Bgt-20920 [Blumeria graminis f. sp. tritici]|uniref:Bgt-20920 n=1 Tax=Blumeria graminis f. sp. tritici TaxID=62690 RepID=A0A9X9L8U0_BLUGR|nr:Bgt-20920 [Blumeria graminis f. sp. tritici]